MKRFAQGMFTIDPRTTPEQLAEKRAAIAAMMPQYGNARYVGQGLGQLFTGIADGISSRQMDKFEAQKQAEAAQQFQGLFGSAATTASPPDQQGTGAQPASFESRAMLAGVSPERARGLAGAIADGLVYRGMTPEQAQGVVMNLHDESGLRPDAVGDNGNAFGLAQWNGPRKAALESFAASKGLPASDVNVQLDYLMHELRGPEARAGQMLAQAQTPGAAASAFLNHFERPAEQHRAAREAKYSGGQFAGAGYDGPSEAALMQALANPWLSEQDRAMAQAMLGRAQKASDPLYNLQLQQAQAELDGLKNPQPKQTDDMREYEFAKSQGFQGTFADYMTQIRRAGASSVTIGSEIEARKVAAEQLGMSPDDPGYQSYILTGKMPREDQAPLTATDKKAILEADEAVQSNQTVIDMLNGVLAPNEDGKSLNDKADYGATSGWQPWFARNDPTGFFDDTKGQATTELQNVVLTQALGQLKATFGAAPTEGERKILVDLQASVDKTPAERAAIIQRAISAAKRRLAFNQDRAAQLRGGTFYKPQGGQPEAAPQQPPAAQSAAPATHRFNPQTGKIEAIQ